MKGKIKRLLSLSDDEYSLKQLGLGAAGIEALLNETGLDGIELMRWEKPQESAVPMNRVIGRHMPYWPIFLDFWRGDKGALTRQFDTEENWCGYYFADSREVFVQSRRSEFLEVVQMGVAYAVVHVSHSELQHCYTGQFAYSAREIVDAYIEMLNEALRGVDAQFELLFENHWLPGLTFLDGGIAARLLECVEYPHKGFVLDISHIMNTCPGLKDEQTAVEYILEKLAQMGEAKRYIRTIHLNSAISGTRTITGEYDAGADFITRLISAMQHVGAMDPHEPFKDRAILKVIDSVQPAFLVYELSAHTLPELRQAVAEQNETLHALGRK